MKPLILTVLALATIGTGCANPCRRRPILDRLFNRDGGRRLEAPAPTTRDSVAPLLIPAPRESLPTTRLDAPPPPRGASVPLDIPPPSLPENRSYRAPQSRQVPPLPPPVMPATPDEVPLSKVPEATPPATIPSDLPPDPKPVPRAKPEKELLLPEDVKPAATSPTPRGPAPVPETRNKPTKELLLPDGQPGEVPANNRSLPGAKLDPPAPAGSTSQKPTTASAAVPGYTVIREGVATGRKPLPEGFETLARSGIKTVVYLHAATVDPAPAKALAERQKLAFRAVAITPDTPSIKRAYETLTELITDSGLKPVYVFDDDGLRAGHLWRLYFQLSQGLAEDDAKVRAGPLGLRSAPEDEAMKRAVDEIVANWKP